MNRGLDEEGILLEQIVERMSYDSKIVHKLAIVTGQTEKSTKAMGIGRNWPVDDCLDLGWVGGNSGFTNHMTQISYGMLGKCAFG